MVFLTSAQVYALEPSGGKWVLVNTTVNPNNKLTEYYGGGLTPGWLTDKMHLGREVIYTVGETHMSHKDHKVERGRLYFDITLKADFDKPPAELTPGETMTLSATVSGSGSGSDTSDIPAWKGKGGSMGLQFQYKTEGVKLEGFENVLGIGGSADGIGEGGKKSGSFVVPEVREGGRIVIKAVLWNCRACLVEWIYQAEGVETTTTTKTSTTTTTVEDDFEDEFFDHPCLDGLSDDEIEKIKAMPGGVSIIDEIEGKVEVLREGDSEWSPAKRYTILNPGEAVRTGPNSDARLIIKKIRYEGDEPYIPLSIQMREQHEERARNVEIREAGGLPYLWAILKSQVTPVEEFNKYEQDTAWIGENSEVCIGAFFEIEERGFLDLIKGAVKVITSGWKKGSIFSVKAGTTLCGIRGSEVIITHNPDSGEVSAVVLEGHMDVTNTKTGEIKSLTDNKKLVVENGVVGDIQTLSKNEWDILVEENGLEFASDDEVEGPETISDSTEAPTLYAEDTSESEGTSFGKIILVLIILIVAVAVIILWKKPLIPMNKKLVVLLVIILLVAIGAMFLSGREKTQPTSQPVIKTSPPMTPPTPRITSAPTTTTQASTTTATTTLSPLTTSPPETQPPTTTLPTTTASTTVTTTTTTSTTTTEALVSGPALVLVDTTQVENVFGLLWIDGSVKNKGDTEALSVQVRLTIYSKQETVLQILNSVPIDRIGPGETLEYNTIRSDKITSAVGRYELTIVQEK